MADAASVQVANLVEAFKRSDRYLTLGLVSAGSLAILSFMPEGTTTTISPVVPGLPPVSKSAASAILLAIAVAAPFLASYSIAHAQRIIAALNTWPDVARAALMYPSIVTTSEHASRFVACFLPMILLGVAYYRDGGRMTGTAAFGFVILVVVPYGGLWGWYLRRPLDETT
jgi:hypothetical protein